MRLARTAAAIVLFAALAVVSAGGPGRAADRAITVALQHSLRSARVTCLATRLVSLGDTANIVPVVAAIGVLLLFFGDGRRGGAALLLAAATLVASLLAGFFQHVIPHGGPPEALKLHAPQPADTAALSLASAYHTAIVIAVAAALRLLFAFVRNRDRNAAAPWLAAVALAVVGAALLVRHLTAGLVPHVVVMLNDYAVYGYPSGHVTRATLLIGTALPRPVVLGAPLVAALMVALVYLGDHWTSEVLGGLCLGWACAEGYRQLWRSVGSHVATARRRR